MKDVKTLSGVYIYTHTHTGSLVKKLNINKKIDRDNITAPKMQG